MVIELSIGNIGLLILEYESFRLSKYPNRIAGTGWVKKVYLASLTTV
jgi:hypothetical protein